MEAAAALSARAILRIVLIIVGVVLCLYLIYLLRKPITWLFIARSSRSRCRRRSTT